MWKRGARRRKQSRKGLTVHVPPFWQGSDTQSSVSMSQIVPVKPASQSHSKPGGGFFS